LPIFSANLIHLRLIQRSRNWLIEAFSILNIATKILLDPKLDSKVLWIYGSEIPN
jgi:hypothetical protein